MNKNLKPFLFILVAALVIGTTVIYYKFFNDDGGGGGGGGTVTNTTSITSINFPVNEYKDKCNLLGDQPWNPNEYTNLKMDLETNSKSGIGLSNETATELLMLLEQKYAQSMYITYENWIDKEGQTNISDLYNAMFKQSSLPGCKAILDTAIYVYNKYQLAVNLPNRVTETINSEYNVLNIDQLKDEINNLCNTPQIAVFPNIASISKNEPGRLDAFSDYYSKIYPWIQYYNDNNSVPDELKEYCLNGKYGKRTNIYLYYSNLFTSKFCN